MVYKGKFKIIDNLITACDYDHILDEISKSIDNGKQLLISPIASHTLVKAHFDAYLYKILQKFDYLLPDSQWVRWSIPFLYGKSKKLDNRVYGPQLMLEVCKLSSKNNFRVFLYGNTDAVLLTLKKRLIANFPKLKIVGTEASVFRNLTKKELSLFLKKLDKSKPNICFISLGSPKQEVFSYELSRKLTKSLVIIPVGAAYNFISLSEKQAPSYMQDVGLEWLYRLINDPKRLYRRYLIFGSMYILMILQERLFIYFQTFKGWIRRTI